MQGQIEDIQSYKDRYERILDIQTERLNKISEKHFAERDILQLEADKHETLLNNRVLRHDLMLRDIEKEQIRMEKLR